MAVEGAVHVGAGVRDHRDLADLELGPRRVAGAARGAAELLADPGPGEAGVGGHAVLDLVAEVDANTAVARGGLL
jgi:hypothetical protein